MTYFAEIAVEVIMICARTSCQGRQIYLHYVWTLQAKISTFLTHRRLLEQTSDILTTFRGQACLWSDGEEGDDIL